MAKRKKKKPILKMKYIIITHDEHQAFLCYNHEKSSISFCEEFDDKISLFQTEKDALDFINHFGKQIGIPLKQIGIPLGELLDDTKVSHLLENIDPEELNKMIQEQIQEESNDE